MKNLLGAFVLTFSLGIFAQAEPDYTLEELDTLKTCTPGTIKEKNGLMAISYMNAHKWWNLKDQLLAHHPDLELWHGSLAGVIAADPSSNARVPFKNGIINNKNFVETFSLVAYLNDISKYGVEIKRLDCFTDNSVVMVVNFNGFQVKRDVNGCITHGLKYGSSGHLNFLFKDYQATPYSRPKRKLYKGNTFLNADYSLGVKARLAKIAKGQPNVAPNVANCKTYSQILEEFKLQVAN